MAKTDQALARPIARANRRRTAGRSERRENSTASSVSCNVLKAYLDLSRNTFELFLDLLPVHHVPPIGNVFGSLVMVLEIIRVFPNIET